jgi:hypothetical protein
VELKNFHAVADGSRSISAMAQHAATYRAFELLPRSSARAPARRSATAAHCQREWSKPRERLYRI